MISLLLTFGWRKNTTVVIVLQPVHEVVGAIMSRIRGRVDTRRVRAGPPLTKLQRCSSAQLLAEVSPVSAEERTLETAKEYFYIPGLGILPIHYDFERCTSVFLSRDSLQFMVISFFKPSFFPAWTSLSVRPNHLHRQFTKMAGLRQS
jgi:hypothetical protein